MNNRSMQSSKGLKKSFLTFCALMTAGVLLGVTPLMAEKAVRSSPRPVFATINFTPIPGAVLRNKERLTRLIVQASHQGARFVVVPERSLVGNLADIGEAEQSQPQVFAETIPGPVTDHFGALCNQLGIWLAMSFLERTSTGHSYYITTILFNEHGKIVNRYRKVMTRRNREDGPVTRGNYRDIIHTTEDRGLQLGILSGDDIQIGVPRLANRGVDTILINAGWSENDRVPWHELSHQLSEQYAVNLVVANPGTPKAQGNSVTRHLGGIYTRHGEVIHPEAQLEDALLLAYLPQRELTWQIESALGLPASVPVPSHQPATEAIAELGRQLFVDPNLSSTGQVSCSSCHQPEKSFSNTAEKGTGVYGRKTKRNVPSLLNVAFRPLLRWDGYASMLENFAKYPISGYNEMDFHYLDKVVTYIRSQRDYRDGFLHAMGVEEIQFDHIARALATYQRTLISGNSPFDRYYYGGEKAALSQSAQRGLELFKGKAKCATCHLIGDQYALFMDFNYHFLGIGYDPEPGQSRDIGLGSISTNDLSGLFQTPSLRDVALTAPYMHDGSIESLEEVVEFFDQGGMPGPKRAPELEPLFLNNQEKADLVTFLQALTGEQRYSAEGRRLRKSTSATYRAVGAD